MTSTATPSLNPEPPVVFGVESHIRSESRPPTHFFTQTAVLATDETQMEHGLGAENCFSRPGFCPPPAENRFDIAVPRFRSFPICVYFVFNPWPIRLSPFALNPRCLETPTDSTVQRFNNSTPPSMQKSPDFAGYVRLCEDDRAGYVRMTVRAI
jgi:hypothetical protein